MLSDSFFYYLLFIGFAAGLMDAAVGGGGLLQIPGLFNLLPASTPVASVMGINKFASCCGTLTATGQYLRKIPVPWKMLLPAAALAFAASYLGANAVAYFPVQYMKPAMLVIMVAMCLYTFLKKDLGLAVRTEKLTLRETLWGLLFGALIGFYDGIFGPGTGSLLAFVFVRFYGYDFLTANASAKSSIPPPTLPRWRFSSRKAMLCGHGRCRWRWRIYAAACSAHAWRYAAEQNSYVTDSCCCCA